MIKCSFSLITFLFFPSSFVTKGVSAFEQTQTLRGILRSLGVGTTVKREELKLNKQLACGKQP